MSVGVGELVCVDKRVDLESGISKGGRATGWGFVGVSVWALMVCKSRCTGDRVDGGLSNSRSSRVTR